MKLNPIKTNLTELVIGKTTLLFSYKTPVACHIEGDGFYRTDYKWSQTTTRYINHWLSLHSCVGTVQTKPQEWFDGYVYSDYSRIS